MAKSASMVAEKYSTRSAGASGDYVKGAQETTKDQAAAAIAAFEITKQATIAALNEGRQVKGLQKSGKGGWLKGVVDVGGGRYAEGVGQAGPSYAAESGRFDSARASSASMPRGLKGSPQNLAKVAKVVSEQIRVKTGRA